MTCENLATWVAIKTSRGLSIDQGEHDALIDTSRTCDDTEVHTHLV